MTAPAEANILSFIIAVTNYVHYALLTIIPAITVVVIVIIKVYTPSTSWGRDSVVTIREIL